MTNEVQRGEMDHNLESFYDEYSDHDNKFVNLKALLDKIFY